VICNSQQAGAYRGFGRESVASFNVSRNSSTTEGKGPVCSLTWGLLTPALSGQQPLPIALSQPVHQVLGHCRLPARC